MKGKMYFQTMLITLMMVVLAGALDVAVAETETAPKLPALTDDDFRPGKTNPVQNPARMTILAQKQLMAVMPYWDHFCTNENQPTNDPFEDWGFRGSLCTNQTLPNYDLYSTDTATAIAAGRVVTPLRDESFGVSYVKSDGGYAVLLFSGKTFPDQDYSVYEEIATVSVGSCEVTLNIIDIAIGDIDGEVDKNGERHDEIVIAYKEYDGCHPRVVVAAIKVGEWGEVSLISTVSFAKNLDDAGFLPLTMGDYNNDGIEEIAVSWLSTTGVRTFQMRVLSYDGEKETLLTRASDEEGPHIYPVNMVDLASGDFNGDGQDELAAVFSSTATDTQVETYVNLYEIDFEKTCFTPLADYADDGYVSSFGASITSGLFKYDPGNGYSNARRQIAVANLNDRHGDSKTKNTVDIFDPSCTCDEDNNCTWRLIHRSHAQIYWDKDYSFHTGTYKPEIVAGRFHSLDYKDSSGNVKITDQIAVSWAQQKKDETPQMKFNAYVVGSDFKLSQAGVWDYGYYFYPHKDYDSITDYAASAPIVAACARENESYYLGVPAHISIPMIISSVRIIQEPPKHLDYLPDPTCEPDKPCDWKIENVSKFDDFTASFNESKTSIIKTVSTSGTGWDIGGSESVTAKETFNEGIPFIASDEVTMEQSESVGYDYKTVQEKTDGHYSSVTFDEDYVTSADDVLQVKTMWMDIWRYPIYGMKTKKDTYAFYEVALPGNVEPAIVTGLGSSDYYQPIHENGNLLSYPSRSDTKFPYDLGSFSVEGQSFTQVMTYAQNALSFGASEQTYSLDWASEDWKEKTTSQKKKLSESLDFKTGFSGKASALIAGGDWSVKVDVSFHNSNSWSKTSYSKSETDTNGHVIVKVPSGPTDMGYSFTPNLYTTTDGTLKLAHTGDPDNGLWFWQHHYRGQPDLSLNLPIKYYWEPPTTKTGYGEWYMNPYRQQRSRMRGIFLLKNKPDDKGKAPYIASSPTAGETIYLQTYVYNYSLDTETGPFKVRFSYAPYNKDLYDKAPELSTIGEVDVKSLAARERREVYVKWDIAKDAGGDEPGGAKLYTIYVTLDPDNEVPNEIHELYVEDQTPSPNKTCPTGKDTYSAPCGIFCASNNQGYWPWDNSFKIFCPSQGTEPLAPLELKLKSESLELGHSSRSEKYGDEVFTHVEYRLKVNITANRGDTDFRDVFFYDNGKLFSMKRSFGLNPGENDFYCRWKPQEPGVHTLKVMIMEAEDDPAPGDNSVSLDVEVLPFNRPIHR